MLSVLVLLPLAFTRAADATFTTSAAILVTPFVFIGVSTVALVTMALGVRCQSIEASTQPQALVKCRSLRTARSATLRARTC